jgi:hypothetical protein
MDQAFLDLDRLFGYKIFIAQFVEGKRGMNSNSNNRDLLSSWKEIADYLGCDERTCRRWELNFGLPVHRMEGTSKPRVYAYKRELDSWRTERLNGSATDRSGLRIEPGTARLGLKRFRLKFLWLVPVFGAIAAAVLSIARLSPGEPADFSIKGSRLIILDEKGNKLWDFDTKLDNLISEQAYRARFQVASHPPLKDAIFPYLFIRDINHDGKNEILFSPKTKDSLHETGLYCFNLNGKELWHYQPGRDLMFGKHAYSADYRIYGMELFDTNDDGILEIFLFTGHIPHSPSQFVMLDSWGRVLGELSSA